MSSAIPKIPKSSGITSSFSTRYPKALPAYCFSSNLSFSLFSESLKNLNDVERALFKAGLFINKFKVLT